MYILAAYSYTDRMDTLAQHSHSRLQDNAHLWRVEALGGVELMRARFAEFTFAPHSHEEFMVVITESGRGVPRFYGEVRRVSTGDVFVVSPAEVHSGGPAEASIWSYRTFYPPISLMQRVVQELTDSARGLPHFSEDVLDDPMLATLLRQAHLIFESPDSRLACEASLLEALARLVTHHAVEKVSAHSIGVEHRAVKRAKAYLEALPGENVSLETLAQEAGISPFRLCRVFRRDTGLSPHAYQLVVRVRLAKTLLTQGTPISQAALEAGFFDQAHLTRHFKRIFGVTPGRYLGNLLPPAS